MTTTTKKKLKKTFLEMTKTETKKEKTRKKYDEYTETTNQKTTKHHFTSTDDMKIAKKTLIIFSFIHH